MALNSLISTATLPTPPPRKPFNVGDSVGTFPPLHVVYVHGFRGDHTSFQRFPTDLHYSLDDRVPSLHTHVFPTYKSRKPLQVAAERLMVWMESLEPGFFILIGHSLGGFVVAEAALQFSKFAHRKSESEVIGMIAMDVPYLGVHPHVIVSGIVSLFPSNKTDETEHSMNDTDKVHMVAEQDASSLLSGPTSPSAGSGRTFANMMLPDLTPGPTALQNTLHFFRKHSKDPLGAMKTWVVSYFEHGSMLLDPGDLKTRYRQLEDWKGGEWVNFYTETVPRDRARSLSPLPSPKIPPPDQPQIHFPEPHPSPSIVAPGEGDVSPLSTVNSRASSSSFHPPDSATTDAIKFPEPVPFAPLSNEAIEEQISASTPDAARPSMASIMSSEADGATHTPHPIPTPEEGPQPLFLLPHPPLDPSQQKKHDKAVKQINKEEAKAAKKIIDEANKEEARAAKKAIEEANKKSPAPERPKSPEPPRRFIITPWDSTPSKFRWQRVPVAGSASEVDAHVGLFFQDKNLEYDAFVQRVAGWIGDTCRARKPEILAY